MKHITTNYNETTTYLVLIAFQYFQAIIFKITVSILLLVRSIRRQAKGTIIIHRSKRKRKLIESLRNYITNCALLYITNGETFVIEKCKGHLPYTYQLIAKFPLVNMTQYKNISLTEKNTFDYKINIRKEVIIKPIVMIHSKLKFAGLPSIPL